MQEDGGGMSGSQEENRAKVPEKAQQDGEVRARWAWAEAAVWTDRMLTALEEGVKGDKWFRLIDKVYWIMRYSPGCHNPNTTSREGQGWLETEG